MSFHIKTSNGMLLISDEQIQGVARHAECQADLTAATLDATGLFSRNGRPFSRRAFCSNSGQSWNWVCGNGRDCDPYLTSDLPTFREAATHLLARARRGPEAFDGPDAALLSRRVLQVWMEHFAWEGPDLLEADFIVGDVDEDQFAQLLADFVWQHRHELSRLLNKQQ